jgi:hypothetical protein
MPATATASASASAPSPLDPPRFADDEPLSVWRIEGASGSDGVKEGAAPVHAIGGTVRVRKAFEEWDSPSDAPQDKPIAIELVRGLNGVDDEAWRVLVDGKLQEVKGDDPHWLPPPFPLDHAYDKDTRVRPLMFGVRLENEALEPARVELVIEQVERSASRQDQTSMDADRAQELRRIPLTPYATRDAAADAVRTPYAIHAPMQSAMGLICYDEMEKANKRAAAKRLQVVAQSTRYKVNIVRRLIKATSQRPYAMTPRVNISKSDFTKLLNSPFYKPEKWKQLRDDGRNLFEINEEDALLNRIREYVLGGTIKTAPSAIALQFDEIRDACEEMANTENKPSFADKIFAMRMYLLTKKSSLAATLLDALATDSLYKHKEALDEYQKELTKAESGGDKEQAVEKVKADYEKAYNALKKADGEKKNTELVFDAMPIQARLTTTVRLRMRVEVIEYGGQTSAFTFESNRDYGAAAQAVYSELSTDIETYKTSATELIECLRKLSVDSTELPKKRSWFNVLFWKSENVLPYTAVFSEMEKTIGYITSVVETTVPAWPPLESLENLEARNQSLLEDDDDSTDDIVSKIDFLDEPGSEDKSTIDDKIVEQLETLVRKEFDVSVENIWNVSSELIPSEAVVFTATRQLQNIVHASSITPTLKPPLDASLPDRLIVPKSVNYGGYSLWQRFKAGLYGFAWQTSLQLLVATAVTAITGGGAGPSAAVSSMSFSGMLRAGKEFMGYDVELQQDTWKNMVNSVIGGTVGGVNNGNLVVEQARIKNLSGKTRDTAYVRALEKVFGNPIDSATEHARFSLIRMYERENVNASEFGLLQYSQETGRRFRFWEVHTLNQDEYDNLALQALYTNEDWDRTPYTTSLILLPPVDVADFAYQTQTLRRLPLANAAKRTTGVVLAPNAPAMLAASAAFEELRHAVDRVYLPPTTLEHVASPSHKTARIMAESGAALIVAAFGAKVGVTLVTGDDPIWQCMPGGHAARLAIRHLPLFHYVEARMRMRASTDVAKLSAELWGPSYKRAMVDAFARELQEKAKASNYNGYSNIADRVIDVAQSYARTRKLSQDAVGALAVVASSAAMLENSWQYRDDVVAQIISEERTPYSDQKGLSMPTPPNETVAIVHRLSTFWAARRVDIGDTRNIPLGNGVGALVDTLSALRMSEDRVQHYYCPVGSRLDALPGEDSPFGAEALSLKLVWIEALYKASTLLQNALRDAEHGTMVDQMRIKPIFAGENVTGFARHPLVVALHGSVVQAFLSKTGEENNATADGETDDDTDLPESLLKAAKIVFDGLATTGHRIRRRVALARTIAFNADRFLHAFALATLNTTESKSIFIESVNSVHHIQALAIALAMYVTEVGGIYTELYVPVAANVRSELHGMLEAIKNVCTDSSKDVHVIKLSEACLAIGGFSAS